MRIHFSSKLWAAISASLSATLITACSVGPNFTAPDAKAPAQWGDIERVQNPPDDMRVPHATDPSVVMTSADPDPAWWKGFNDPELNALIERGAAGNLDLQSAILRIQAARDQTKVSAAQGLPSLSGSASYTREQEGIKGLLKSTGNFDTINSAASGTPSISNGLNAAYSPINLYQDSFDASWELDLFGRVRRSVEANKAQTQSSMEDRNDSLVSLEAEIAQDYSQLRGAQLLTQVTLAEIDSEQQILELTREQARVGLTSQSDVQSAMAQVGSLKAQLPQYEAKADEMMDALAVLVGLTPGALDSELKTPGALPPVPPTVPVGLPSTLARRRPDIRRAEAQLHAATAQIGVAVAQMYPDVSLTGSAGTRALSERYLSHWSSLFWSFGPSISLPLFEGGSLRANVRIAKAQAGEAALSYRSTVLKALQDVDKNLINYRTDQDRRAALQATVDANQTSLYLARESYRKGLVNFINVLDAERQLAGTRQQLTQATVTVTTDLIALYKSLGGGWQEPGAADASGNQADAAAKRPAVAVAG